MTRQNKTGQSKMRRKLRWQVVAIPLACVTVAAVVVILIAQPFGGSAGGGGDYLTEAVTRGDLEKSISSSGQLAAGEVTSVSANSGGEVASVAVEVGEYVQSGDTLFKLAAGDLKVARDVAGKRLSAAQSQLSAANSGLKAAKATVVQTVAEILAQTPSPDVPTAAQKRAAQKQVEQQKANKSRAIAASRAEIANASAGALSARQEYSNAVAALDERVVKAPVSGTITALNVAVGDTVSGSGGGGTVATDGGSGTAAVEISSFDKTMSVVIDVTEAEVDDIEVGMEAEVVFDAFADLRANGKVSAIAPTGTASGGLVMFSVMVKLSDPDARLRPGMNATVKIIQDVAKDVLLVPNTALEGDEASGYSVRVLSSDGGIPEVRSVEVGLANDTYSEVLSGLSEGEIVITGTLSSDTSGGSGPGGFMGGMGGGHMIGGVSRVEINSDGAQGRKSDGPQIRSFGP